MPRAARSITTECRSSVSRDRDVWGRTLAFSVLRPWHIAPLSVLSPTFTND
jgi:hypothetical protein